MYRPRSLLGLIVCLIVAGACAPPQSETTGLAGAAAVRSADVSVTRVLATLPAPTPPAETATSSPPQPSPSPTIGDYPPPPTRTPSPYPGQLPAYPLETRTGVDAVDAILEAIARGDRETLRARLQFTAVGCTNEKGLGGPPKCWGGGADHVIDPPLAEGTLLNVLPIFAHEGQWIFPYSADSVLNALLSADRIFAIYEVQAVDDEIAPLTPYGRYAILFLDPDDRPFEVSVDDGIVSLTMMDGRARPQDALPTNAAQFLLPPH